VNIFISEPDIYESINFHSYGCFSGVYLPNENPPYDHITAIFVGLKYVVDDEFLNKFTNLKYIVSSTTGIDHIKTTRNIQIINLDPQEILEVSATAEFSLALLLSLVRKIPFVDHNKTIDRQIYRGIQLKGKKIGILGYGRIGKKMAIYADALEMQWISFDKNDSFEKKTELLNTCDIISIHIPLLDSTIDFISHEEFKQMLNKPYIINTSRPQLINKEALIIALDSGLISGLAMDFISYEADNQWDKELKKHLGGKLLLTPHIAGNTHESIRITSEVVADKLVTICRKTNDHHARVSFL
jgi:D-3-phosphoglycerate dehydrogenase / 2-oxoglutarate reductase